MRRLTMALLAVAALIGWQLTEGEPLSAETGSAFECAIAGTWIDEFPDGSSIIYTLAPLDPTGQRVSMVGSPVTGLTVGGLFPDAAQSTEFRGAAERVDEATWRFTIRRIISDAAGTPLYTQITSGYGTFVDCDTISAVYANEFITPDGTTVLCVPGASPAVRRLPIEEPCTGL